MGTANKMLSRCLRSDRVPGELDIAEIAQMADAFDGEIKAAKNRLNEKGSDVQWYPYGTLSCFSILEKLLTGERRRLLRLAGDNPILDAGCADGDLAFFLERLGCTVEGFDYPATNYNSMRGARALKAELNSSVEIWSMDIDSQFVLPRRNYGLAFFLGTLYHLKNPYYALETIARSALYCVLSTRVARFTPDRRTRMRHLPVAYLLEEGEANQDWTNYWIFSETGLRRILKRAGWEILDWLLIGNLSDSDPASCEGDERAFCLLKSRPAERARGVELLEGWHDLEYNAWRWTEKRFSVRLRAPETPNRVMLKVGFFLPEPLVTRFGAIRLAATVDGAPLPAQDCKTPGEHEYAQVVPSPVPAGQLVVIEFELDHALPPDDEDPRERGVIVSSIQLE